MIKLALIGGIPESLINFRGVLLDDLVCRGVDVHAISGQASGLTLEQLKEKKVSFHAAPVARNSLNPIADIWLLIRLIFILLKLKPSVVVSYTIKPIIWGGFAARFTNARFIALVTGLGFAFQGDSLKRRMLTRAVTFLYKASLKKADAVIFQNADNARLFITLGIVDPARCHVVNGSGVNTSHFYLAPLKQENINEVSFLCVARLLKEKGLSEYAVAANIVKHTYPHAEFKLVGPEDPSPDGLDLNEVMGWDGITYLGESNDVRPYIAESHVYVLPSYHEGLPRSTQEAMSMGRPVITTNAVGCKETVNEGINGFKVDVGDSIGLAERMVWCIENKDKLSAMGMESRKMVEDKFDVHKVNAHILKIMGIE